MAAPGYQGVVLAAGHGSRMGPFGERYPKPIVPICNKPLLAYQLEQMRAVGITDVIVVIGHLGHRIIQEIGDGSAYGLSIRYVEQEKRLGLAHAVGQLEAYVSRPFLLLLGDIFFQVTNLHDMMEQFEFGNTAAVLAVKEETDAEAVKRNFSVQIRADGTVRRVIEKPRHVESLLKGCGLYLFDERIFDGIRRTPRTAMRDEYELTDSIQILIDYEYPVRVARVVEWDMNVTYLGDLIACCVHELRRRGASHIIGESCTIACGTELVDTAVGDHVTIGKRARLRRCVVLPNVVLDDGVDYEDTIITADAKLDTRHSQ